ncbi:rhodanese-like protein [Dictyocaulus viviparus]|uniref:M-phase inducer phosphatase n=1 Tax=Dictyocaulus viviparus TaxID=29172 RepID=A0A0D8XLI6_DICVI|nr:rhodanese-like protein [Dictyocaulus viviparus]
MASSTSHRDTDESSRDSGFSEMECDSMPVDFAHPSLVKTLTPLKLKNLDMEMDDLVIEESLEIPTSNMICTKKEELEVKTVLSNMRLLRKGLADVTNSVRTAFAESPKSRKSLFVKPYLRSASMYNKRKHGDIEDSLHYKRHKVGGVIEEDENVPSCSVSSASLRLSRPSLMFRVQSSSVLEMGHHLPQFHEVNYHLETVTTNDSQAFRRIDASTLCRLMKSMSTQDFADKYVLIDCRYPYEFNGGHIKGAINIFDVNKCEEIFYPSNSIYRTEMQRKVPIFYCEYSQKRGPSMAQMLRKIDRQRNVEVYPKVDFPEIYVVDKGYRNFFEMLADSSDRHLCEPCSYVTMVDCRFAHHLKKFNFHKKSWGNTTCSKTTSSQSRLALRKFSDGALDSPSSTGIVKPSSRRPLFSTTPKTPEPTPPTPIRQLHFS